MFELRPRNSMGSHYDITVESADTIELKPKIHLRVATDLIGIDYGPKQYRGNVIELADGTYIGPGDIIIIDNRKFLVVTGYLIENKSIIFVGMFTEYSLLDE
jgi:hypothetical protein